MSNHTPEYIDANDWFGSLPKDTQDFLRASKWAMVNASFEAGREQLAAVTAQLSELMRGLEISPVFYGPAHLYLIGKSIADQAKEVYAVTAQRDELLAALKGITYKDGEEYFTAIQDGVPLREVRHAIAKCEVQNDG